LYIVGSLYKYRRTQVRGGPLDNLKDNLGGRAIDLPKTFMQKVEFEKKFMQAFRGRTKFLQIYMEHREIYRKKSLT
jgi:hypothetical protein